MDPLSLIVGFLTGLVPLYIYWSNQKVKRADVLEEAHAQLAKIRLVLYRVLSTTERLQFNKLFDKIENVRNWFNSNTFKLPKGISNKFGRFLLLSESYMIQVFNKRSDSHDEVIWEEFKELQRNIADSILRLKGKNPFRKLWLWCLRGLKPPAN